MQQQATSHIGSCTVTFRAYGWHDDDIEAFKKMREEEDMELLQLADVGIGVIAIQHPGQSARQFSDVSGATQFPSPQEIQAPQSSGAVLQVSGNSQISSPSQTTAYSLSVWLAKKEENSSIVLVGKK
jgi:hypothetical protein